MNDDMERHQVIYNVIKTQIQFGVYRLGDILPTMKQAAGIFLVSLETIRFAYLRLQREGYIILIKNAGSTVIKDYSEQELEANIQIFFSGRKKALLDLSKSFRPLLSYAQWTGIKHAPGEIYHEMSQLGHDNSLEPYIALHHITQAYSSLENELFFRLLWQIFMFFEAPFFSIPGKPWSEYAIKEYAPRTMDLFLKQDWESLRELIYIGHESFSHTVSRFYETRITMPAKEEIPFTWCAYEKASQICYSLAMEILNAITRGQYPVDTFLPSLDKLSKEKQVSVSTIRRTISLLNDVCATKSFKGVGTKVLSFDGTAENCDFTKPAVRKRLLDMAQSLQILTLSCHEVSLITISSLDTAGRQDCIRHLSGIMERQQYELITYCALDILKRYAPYQTIRTVYGELLQQLFWGYPLRGIWKNDQNKVRYYISCLETFIRLLEEGDSRGFSDRLNELLIHEFHFTIMNLVELGISEASRLLIPDIS